MRKILSHIAICITAILVIALCGCDDLGAYEDTEEYYDSFGDIILIDNTNKEVKEYSVPEFFYNEETRENFLLDESGAYKGVLHKDYEYMAIPFNAEIDMDSLSLYMHSGADATVQIYAYLIGSSDDWDDFVENGLKKKDSESSDEETDTKTETKADGEAETSKDGSTDTQEKVYPDPNTKIAEATLRLKKDKWNSFSIDSFTVNGAPQKSILVDSDQYILLRFMNNSTEQTENQSGDESQSANETQKIYITMTNLLIRSLNEDESEEQGGE